MSIIMQINKMQTDLKSGLYGGVVQVKQGYYAANQGTTSTSFVNMSTDASVEIVPKFKDSIYRIEFGGLITFNGSGATYSNYYQLNRTVTDPDGNATDTQLTSTTSFGSIRDQSGGSHNMGGNANITYLDTAMVMHNHPSKIKYTIQHKSSSGSGNCSSGGTDGPVRIILTELNFRHRHIYELDDPFYGGRNGEGQG